MRLHERLLRSVAFTSAISIPSIFVATGYFGLRWSSQLNASTNECTPSSPRLGQHCLAAVPAFVGHNGATLALWLLALAACVLLPILWASRAAPAPTRAVEILLFGISTTPLLVTLNSGSAAPLLVPPVLWFGLSFARNRNASAALAVGVAAFLRPELLLLALVFVFRRDLRHFAYALLAGAVGVALHTVLLARDLLAQPLRWFTESAAIDGGSSFFPLPANLGSGRSGIFLAELLWTRLLGNAPQADDHVLLEGQPPMASVLRFANDRHGLVVLALVLAGIAVVVGAYRHGHRLTRFTLLVAGSTLPLVLPTSSPVHALPVVLVPVAVLLRTPSAHREFFDVAPYWLERLTQGVFVAATTVSVVPTALPLDWLVPAPSYHEANAFLALVGPLWLLWGALVVMAILLPTRWIVKTGWRARSAPSR